ncbi:MAG: hypothetical protein M3381_08820 [Actinomycetota bacterium]|nr:hypothetical protein [Actinomycetota bacterium]
MPATQRLEAALAERPVISWIKLTERALHPAAPQGGYQARTAVRDVQAVAAVELSRLWRYIRR